jgi:hypothetical protein
VTESRNEKEIEQNFEDKPITFPKRKNSNNVKLNEVIQGNYSNQNKNRTKEIVFKLLKRIQIIKFMIIWIREWIMLHLHLISHPIIN